MGYEKIFSNVNFNFQVNRILTYGDTACNRDEVIKASRKITDFESWIRVWKELGEKAEKQKRYVHSMYYHRLAEFFMMDSNPEKDNQYYKCIELFNKAFPNAQRHSIPFKDKKLPCIYIENEKATKTILMHGGYDSFIEEFYLTCLEIAKKGYNIVLFEGEGQGGALRQGLTFNHKWERSVNAVLDYFNLDDVALIGISWGGYFALRAAAKNKKINEVVAYDVCYDGLDVQFHLMKPPARAIIKFLYEIKAKNILNKMIYKKMQKDDLARWAISHGMYITGTKSPYDFFQSIEKHTLKDLVQYINQKVLLLAGEKDHYIPIEHYYILKNKLTNAKVYSRLFTKEEGGEQHCQIGNHMLAFNEIVAFLR